MKLTAGQEEGQEKLSKFVGSNAPFFRLKGSAGTGKTWLTEGIPAMRTQGEVMATAPTHKALGVLMKRVPGVEGRTIHSFLGLKPKNVQGKSVLQRGRHYDASQFYQIRTVLLDEDSMVDTQLLRYIEEDVKTWGRQYVLVGDQFQLFPVGERSSPCFDLPLHSDHETELTEIVRCAADNPIIQCATSVRDAIIYGKEPQIKGGIFNGNGVHLLKREQWLNKMHEFATEHPDFRTDPDYCRVIAYKNETTLGYNQRIRNAQGGDESTPFSPGDNVVANEAWTPNDEIVFGTGAEFTISAMESHTHPVYPQLEGWQVWFKDFPCEYPVFVLDKLRCGNAYKKRLEDLRNAAKQPGNSWRPFYALSEYFADIRLLSSLTAHKSQGSTFKNVMVDLKDIYSTRGVPAEADRALYVAITRASENVYILM